MVRMLTSNNSEHPLIIVQNNKYPQIYHLLHAAQVRYIITNTKLFELSQIIRNYKYH